jgi:DNA-directed RNA polymerase specialized sigma24 family protein
MSSNIRLSRSVDRGGDRVPPGPVADRAHLLSLVGRIAVEDRGALAELYDALSARLFKHLRRSTSDPVEATAVTNATFVEVWCLARFHAAPHTDVAAWIADIAARRTADRRWVAGRGAQADTTPDRSDAPGRRLCWVAAADSHDHHTRLVLAALLDRPIQEHVSA